MIADAMKLHEDDIGHLPLHQQALAWGVKKNIDARAARDERHAAEVGRGEVTRPAMRDGTLRRWTSLRMSPPKRPTSASPRWSPNTGDATDASTRPASAAVAVAAGEPRARRGLLNGVVAGALWHTKAIGVAILGVPVVLVARALLVRRSDSRADARPTP